PGGSAGTVAGEGDESSAVGEDALVADERLFDEGGGGQVGEDSSGVDQSVGAQVEGRDRRGIRTHEGPPRQRCSENRIIAASSDRRRSRRVPSPAQRLAKGQGVRERLRVAAKTP